MCKTFSQNLSSSVSLTVCCSLALEGRKKETFLSPVYSCKSQALHFFLIFFFCPGIQIVLQSPDVSSKVKYSV